jgi:hypothetical protein
MTDWLTGCCAKWCCRNICSRGAYCLHHIVASTYELSASFCDTGWCSLPEDSHLHAQMLWGPNTSHSKTGFKWHDFELFVWCPMQVVKMVVSTDPIGAHSCSLPMTVLVGLEINWIFYFFMHFYLFVYWSAIWYVKCCSYNVEGKRKAELWSVHLSLTHL